MRTFGYAILCNGAFPRNGAVLHEMLQADRLVCCDGAADKVLSYRKPDVVVGDLDSISSRASRELEAVTVRFSEQETNDLSKAFRYVLDDIRAKRNGERISLKIYGATGLREDHMLGNISLLSDFLESLEDFSGRVKISMVTDFGIFLPVSDSLKMELPVDTPVSVFAFDPTLKICSRGLKYPMDGVTFDMWWKATLNTVEKSPIELIFSHKSKALLYLARK